MKGIGYIKNLRNFLRLFFDFFWIFGGIFWEDDEFFRRMMNFLGEIVWEDFFGWIF